jgi:hypothetical protein
MPWRKQRTATFYDKEIFKVLPMDGVPTKGVVIDGTTITQDPTSGRYVLEAGQLLVKIAASTKVKPAPASGVVQADVVGFLTHTIEFFYPPEAGVTDEPASVYYTWCHFDATKLVGYSGNAAAVAAALPNLIIN